MGRRIRRISRLKKRILTAALLLSFIFTGGGCTQVEQKDTMDKKELQFTVMREANIPEELQTEIAKHKEEGFRTTFRDTQYLYIAAGYGEQDTGGYSISVEELYTSAGKIHLKTKLIGPKKGEAVNQACSYPYLVIKLELREEDVEFE